MDIALTFQTTRDAIAGERLLLDAGEQVRVMPLPGSIAAGCGICLRLPHDRGHIAARIFSKNGISPQGMFLRVGDVYKPFPPPVFSCALGVVPGDVVAIAGCGGKTALANRLAMENRHRPVLFSTTTRIFDPPASVVDYRVGEAEQVQPGINLACEQCGDKLKGFSPDRLERMLPHDGPTILEADGARGLPLKGWAEREPVIPPYVTMTVGVCTMQPVGSVFADERAHRPELFRSMSGIRPGERIGISHIASMVDALFAKARGRRVLFINQTESSDQERDARQLAERASEMRIVAGSVLNGSAVVLAEG